MSFWQVIALLIFLVVTIIYLNKPGGYNGNF